MPEMTEPRELLLHELGDLLFAEKSLTKTLPKLAEESASEELSDALRHHLEETRTHVENLESAFNALGEPAEAEKCPGIEGLKKEHDEFMKTEQPTREIGTMFLVGATTRTEHYEIAAYTTAITLAESLGEDGVVKLLEQNLKQEEAALQKVSSIGRKLVRQPARS